MAKDRSFSCSNCSQQSKKMSINPYKRFINRWFGKWKVISNAGRKKLSDGRFALFFKCECECGAQSEIRAAELKRGTTTQCRKCGTKNNRYPCKICKCKNHFDVEKNLCELLGFCGQCDKFCCMNCIIDDSMCIKSKKNNLVRQGDSNALPTAWSPILR